MIVNQKILRLQVMSSHGMELGGITKFGKGQIGFYVIPHLTLYSILQGHKTWIGSIRIIDQQRLTLEFRVLKDQEEGIDRSSSRSLGQNAKAVLRLSQKMVDGMVTMYLFLPCQLICIIALKLYWNGVRQQILEEKTE